MTWPATQPEKINTRSKRMLKEAAFQLAERPLAWRRIRRRREEIRRLVEAVDMFIAPVEFLRQRMIEGGVPPEKLVRLDYGTRELPFRRRSEHRRPRIRFAYLGGASHEKGIHVLLDAFEDVSGAELVIYGSISEDFHRANSERLDRPNVVVGGVIDDAEKAAVLPDFDAVVVPSIWYENSPLVIHEAFQAGVPVICSDVGGMAELVDHGRNGLHFRVADADALRRTLLTCVRSPERLESLRAGVAHPKSMGDHVEHELLPLYRKLRDIRPPTVVENVSG